MFDKLKQGKEMLQMRSQLMDMQKKLHQITHMHSERGLEVIVAGDQTIVGIKIDGTDRKDLVDAINKAFKEVQKKSQKQMMDMTGGLSGLLGKM